MKTTLAAALILCSCVAGFGQGTIGLRNNTSTRIQLVNVAIGSDGYLLYGPANAYPTTAMRLNFGVFLGTSQTSLWQVPTLVQNSTLAAGIIDAPFTFALPATSEGDTVWMQIKGWDASYGPDWRTALEYTEKIGREDIPVNFCETDIRQIQLGPISGPGTVIWQSASGTDPNKFKPMVFYAPGPVPEPGTLTLLGLGGVLIGIGRRWRRL